MTFLVKRCDERAKTKQRREDSLVSLRFPSPPAYQSGVFPHLTIDRVLPFNDVPFPIFRVFEGPWTLKIAEPCEGPGTSRVAPQPKKRVASFTMPDRCPVVEEGNFALRLPLPQQGSCAPGQCTVSSIG
jgi:hypothetical protein